MAIAQQHENVSLAVDALDLKNPNPRLLGNPVPHLAEHLKRFWWHAKAYGIILGILLMLLGSLVFLSTDWFCRKVLSIPNSQEHESNTLTKSGSIK